MENLIIAKDVIERIQNGVETETGDIREFDIVDFLNLYGLDIIKFYDSVKDKLEPRERKILAVFYGKFVPSRFVDFCDSISARNSYDYAIMMGTNYIENIELDENGEMIPGTGRVITEEEKLRIIDFYENFGVRVTYKMLCCAIKRVAAGHDLEQTERSL